MIANGMKAVAGKAYLLISGLTPMPQTTDHMTLIESSPKRVIAYFGDPKVSYAASHK